MVYRPGKPFVLWQHGRRAIPALEVVHWLSDDDCHLPDCSGSIGWGEERKAPTIERFGSLGEFLPMNCRHLFGLR